MMVRLVDVIILFAARSYYELNPNIRQKWFIINHLIQRAFL